MSRSAPVDVPRKLAGGRPPASKATIVQHSYRTLEGSLGAAFKLSRLTENGPAEVWQGRESRRFFVRSPDAEPEMVHVIRVAVVCAGRVPLES